MEVETTPQVVKTTTLSKQISTKEDETVIVTTPLTRIKTTTETNQWSSTPSPSITPKHKDRKICAERESSGILWTMTEAGNKLEELCPQDLNGRKNRRAILCEMSFNLIVKSIETCQPVLYAQAEMGRNILLFAQFPHVHCLRTTILQD